MLMLLIGALASAQPTTARPMTAIEAERAFAAEAQAKGQWTAFRHWADPTAVMFTPQAVWAQQFLNDRKDPPTSVAWAPDRSVVSCDGRTAVSTGVWRDDSGATGGFYTVWMRQQSGDWRWTVDGLAPSTAKTLPARATTIRASCVNRAAAARVFAATTAATAGLTQPPGDAGQGRSADGTLTYRWTVSPDGARRFTLRRWDGRAYRVATDMRTAAPAPATKP